MHGLYWYMLNIYSKRQIGRPHAMNVANGLFLCYPFFFYPLNFLFQITIS